MICNFEWVKSHKIYNNLSTTEAWEKISPNLEPMELKKNFDACSTKIFRNNEFLLNKISHWFLVSTEWNILIIQNIWKITINIFVLKYFYDESLSTNIVPNQFPKVLDCNPILLFPSNSLSRAVWLMRC